MTLSNRPSLESPGTAHRHLRPPAPLHFPVEERLPEGDDHFQRRILLYSLVKLALGDTGLVCSDVFVYWDPTDPGERLAPDLAVRLGAASESIRSWKIWERGAPHLGVELVSESDESARALDEKLFRYRRAGIREVVRFDPRENDPVRLWDLVDGDLVERAVDSSQALRSDVLGLYFCVRDLAGVGPALRLSHDPAGAELLPTPEEAALARVRELEAELSKR